MPVLIIGEPYNEQHYEKDLFDTCCGISGAGSELL